MKKYQQLLIVSLGLVSFICFLIYKHEYDRLRNVLEVLEVFGTPPPNALGSQSHPLDLNHNPALAAGSINELNLGVGQQGNYDNAQHQAQLVADDTFVPKNGHGVRPQEDINNNDDHEPGGGVEDVNKKHNVIQNPIQNSGEVMDDGGGGGAGGGDDGVAGNFGALKAKKPAQRQDSIFRDSHHGQFKNGDNNV